MSGQITAHDNVTGSLTVNVVQTGGSGTFANWIISVSAITKQVATQAEMQAGTESNLRDMSPLLVKNAISSLAPKQAIGFETRTSNTNIVKADLGKIIDLSGTFTQTFDSAANLGAGWYCYLRANGPVEVLGTELMPSTDIAAWTGANVVVNGSFSADANWTKGAGWTISGGVANGAATTGSLTATVAPLTPGRMYRVTYTVTVTSGTCRVVVGGINGTTRSASGTYTEYFVANTTAFLLQGVTAFTGTIDNVSAEDLTANHNLVSALEVGQDYQLSYTLANIGTNKALKVTIGSTGMGASRQDIAYTKRFTAGSSDTTISLSAFIDSATAIGSGLFTGKPVTSISLKKIVSNGTITLAPNAGDTIDGLSGFTMYPREVRLIWSDGATLRSMVLAAYYKEFYASGTYTKPPGYSIHEGWMWSGGHSGTVGGAGGAGSGAFQFQLTGRGFDTVPVVIGSGGAEATGASNSGGVSSFGSLSMVQGVGLPNGIVKPAPSGASTTAIGFDYIGSASGNTVSTKAIYAGGCPGNQTNNYFGSGSIYGAGAGASSTNAACIATTSVFAGNGGTCGSGNFTWGEAGFEPAGGGGVATTISGAGARGEIRIWGVI